MIKLKVEHVVGDIVTASGTFASHDGRGRHSFLQPRLLLTEIEHDPAQKPFRNHHVIRHEDGRHEHVAPPRPQPETKPERPSMNIDDISGKLVDRIGGPTSEARRTTRALVEVLIDELGKGFEVRLGDLGNFQLQDKPERQARNPATGEAVTVPAKRVVVFKPSKRLRDTVDQKGNPDAG